MTNSTQGVRLGYGLEVRAVYWGDGVGHGRRPCCQGDATVGHTRS